MTPWMVVLLAGIGSYLLRLSMISTSRIRLPARLDEPIALAAPAAFAALATTNLAEIVLSGGTQQAPAAVAAAAVAVLAVARTGSPYAAIVAGMPTFWMLTALH